MRVEDFQEMSHIQTLNKCWKELKILAILDKIQSKRETSSKFGIFSPKAKQSIWDAIQMRSFLAVLLLKLRFHCVKNDFLLFNKCWAINLIQLASRKLKNNVQQTLVKVVRWKSFEISARVGEGEGGGGWNFAKINVKRFKKGFKKNSLATSIKRTITIFDCLTNEQFFVHWKVTFHDHEVSTNCHQRAVVYLST